MNDKYPPPPKDYARPEDDPRFISGLFPTSAELAEQLSRQGLERFIGVKIRKQPKKNNSQGGKQQ